MFCFLDGELYLKQKNLGRANPHTIIRAPTDVDRENAKDTKSGKVKATREVCVCLAQQVTGTRQRIEIYRTDIPAYPGQIPAGEKNDDIFKVSTRQAQYVSHKSGSSQGSDKDTGHSGHGQQQGKGMKDEAKSYYTNDGELYKIAEIVSKQMLGGCEAEYRVVVGPKLVERGHGTEQKNENTLELVKKSGHDVTSKLDGGILPSKDQENELQAMLKVARLSNIMPKVLITNVGTDGNFDKVVAKCHQNKLLRHNLELEVGPRQDMTAILCCLLSVGIGPGIAART